MSQTLKEQKTKAIRTAMVFPASMLAMYLLGLTAFGSVLINGFGS